MLLIRDWAVCRLGIEETFADDLHGVLVLNAFVSFRVLFQCKRYVGSVSPSNVRDFRGAMLGRADKGLIMRNLVSLFASLELGLRAITTYDLDESFFEEYQR